ncbi:hypothetical protein DWV07_11500 [Dickeya zeae]|nr:hypothetical protein DWV07_11500 [Dickeya zeae]
MSRCNSLLSDSGSASPYRTPGGDGRCPVPLAGKHRLRVTRTHRDPQNGDQKNDNQRNMAKTQIRAAGMVSH